MNLKSNYGQYFTEEDLCDLIVKKTLKYVDNPKNGLEPSFGGGQFIKSMNKVLPNLKIDAFEVDKEIFSPVDGANCYLDDFLFTKKNLDSKYSIIFGNPPYIELVYSFYNEKRKEEFRKLFSKPNRGRVNLVHAFFDKSFELIEDGGVISYLLPSAVLSSPWYNEIREKIYHEYTIKEIIEDVNFKGVSIQVSLLILKKEVTKKKPFIIKKGDVYQITERNHNFKGSTIKDLGYNVGVGPYCWSHYRPELNDNNLGYKLLYSSYLTENGIVEIENRNKEKKPYINLENPKIYTNAIILPRTTSKTIKTALVENNTEFVFENHIIYITHNDVSELRRLYNQLTNNQTSLQTIFNSSNISKTEVENIICFN
jgi:hypothetical protein